MNPDLVATPPHSAEQPVVGSGAQAQMTPVVPFWSMPYLLVLVAQTLCYASNTMLAPVLPLYLDSMGFGPVFVGVVLATFSVTSFGLRPFVGRSVDRWSPKGMHALGSLALGASSAVFVITNAATLLVARALQGVGWAAINTSGALIAAEVTPGHRRGEAMGYYNMTHGLAKALAPSLGLLLLAGVGFPPVFLLSSVLGLAAVAAVLLIHEPERLTQDASHGKPGGALIEKRALLTSVLNILINSAHPVTTSFVALFARDRGIENLAVFFLANGATAIAAQALTRLSDRFGRAPIIAVGFASVVISMLVMFSATSLQVLVLGGILYSLGSAVAEPTMMALTIDRSPRERRGAALATYTAAFQVGSGLFGLLWGFVIELAGYGAMFLGAATLVLAGLAILALNWTRAGGGRWNRGPSLA